MDASQPGGLGGTFGGNPVACAAAIAVFERIERDNVLAEATRIEAGLRTALVGLQQQYPVIAEIRGIGAMIAIELLDPETHAPRADLVGAIAAEAAQRGVLLLTAGTYGSVLRFLPSLALTDELLADAMNVLAESFAAATA
jgi:4-aminobutyrate aminotransferase/(S)-3-amino-2-methylpropionate transaminase